MLGIGFDQRLSIYIQYFIPLLDHVTAGSNDPLYKILFRILRILKNDDITLFRATQYQKLLVSEGNFCAVDELVNQNVVTNQKGWNHRPRRYFKCLYDIRPYDKGEDKGRNDSFYVFP